MSETETAGQPPTAATATAPAGGDLPLTHQEADPQTADPNNPMNMPPNLDVQAAPRCPYCRQYLPQGQEDLPDGTIQDGVFTPNEAEPIEEEEPAA